MKPLEREEHINLTTQDHYTAILPCLHGYDVAGHSGSDSMEDTWIQQKN